MVVALGMNIRLTTSHTANETSTEAGVINTTNIHNETQIERFDTEDTINSTIKADRRSARQITLDKNELIVKTGKAKRQVIKIPPNVSKVKVMAQPVPNIRFHNRVRQPYKPNNNYYAPVRKGPPRRYNNKKRPGPDPEYDYDYEFEEPEYHPPKKAKRNPKRPKAYIKEVTPQEFYEDLDDIQNLPTNHVQILHKKPKKPVQAQGPPKKQRSKLKKYKPIEDDEDEIEEYEEKPILKPKRPSFEEESGYEVIRPGRYREHNSEPYKYHDDYEHSYDTEFGASSIHMKQVPAPNLSGLKVVDPPNMVKDPHTVKKSKATSDELEYKLKKTPSTRQIQSLFPQQYTTHNPHVTTNFGLTDGEGYRASVSGYSYNSEHAPYEHGKYSQAVAASEQYINQVPNVPSGSSGIHVVQPPQFG